MTKTFISRLAKAFNYFEDEPPKRLLSIAMQGSHCGERLVHKLGTKSARETEQDLRRHLSRGCVLMPLAFDRLSLMLPGSCAISQTVSYRRSGVEMNADEKRQPYRRYHPVSCAIGTLQMKPLVHALDWVRGQSTCHRAQTLSEPTHPTNDGASINHVPSSLTGLEHGRVKFTDHFEQRQAHRCVEYSPVKTHQHARKQLLSLPLSATS